MGIWRPLFYDAPMTPPSRTTIISVCYNSLAVLPAMLASVPAGTSVILVDNASADPASLGLLAEKAGARVIRNAENKGFGVACNIGAAAAATEFLLFLNPDAALRPGAVATLEAAMDRYPDASAMNPRLSDGKGRPYFKRRSVLLPRRSWLPAGWPAADRTVPVLTGAALFVRRAAFQAVGGFDPAIFLYHEDDDLSLRLATRAGPLMFIHAAEVRHLEGHSTVRSPESAAFKAFHMGRSRVYAMRKHGRPLPFLSSLLSALMQVMAVWALFSRRSRAKRRAFLKGVFAGNRQRRRTDS